MNLFNLVAGIVTLASAVLSIYFYVRSRRLKQLVFAYSTTAIQTKTHPDVSISFRGHDITNLHRLRGVCWNAGRAAIRYGDIPEDDWPKITFPGSRILSITILQASNLSVGFACYELKEAEVSVRFRYLNTGDGAVIEVLTDSSAETADANFSAVIVDGETPLVRKLQPLPPSTSLHSSPTSIWLQAACWPEPRCPWYAL